MAIVLLALIVWTITLSACVYGVCYALGLDTRIPLAVILGISPLIPTLALTVKGGAIRKASASQAQQQDGPPFSKRPVYVPPPPRG